MDASVIVVKPIPGIPLEQQQRLSALFAAQAQLEEVWLFGSRAMGRHQDGSAIDCCLVGDQLGHSDRLRLMAAIDDLLLPWQVDLALWQELPAHLERVVRCIWRRGSPL